VFVDSSRSHGLRENVLVARPFPQSPKTGLSFAYSVCVCGVCARACVCVCVCALRVGDWRQFPLAGSRQRSPSMRLKMILIPTTSRHPAGAGARQRAPSQHARSALEPSSARAKAGRRRGTGRCWWRAGRRRRTWRCYVAGRSRGQGQWCGTWRREEGGAEGREEAGCR